MALGALIITLGFTACHQSVIPSEAEKVGSCEVPVRITAKVSPYVGSSPTTNTRAEVDGSVENEKIGDWKPQEEVPAQLGESHLSRLYVFVTKRGRDEVVKTLYYYAEDYDHTDVKDGKIIDSEIPARQFTNPSSGEVSMDMTLLPGDYSFLLVANSRAATVVVNETKKLKLSDLDKVFTDVNSFVAVKHETYTSDYEYNFPIIGYGELSVPATKDPNKRVNLTPEIPMERQMARVDVTLTTATDESKTNYLSEDKEGAKFDPSKYRLAQFLVLECVDASEKQLYPYILFPVEGEFSALPAGLPRYPRDKYSPPVILDDEGEGTTNGYAAVSAMCYLYNVRSNPFWKDDINNGKTGGLRRLWRQSPIYMYTSGGAPTPTGGGPSYMYLPSVYFGDVSEPDKVVRLQLKFSKLDGTETLVYRIPIHNETGASDYYSIRRNTIYHIDLTFYGKKLEVKQSNAEYIVETWEDQPVDVPW